MTRYSDSAAGVSKRYGAGNEWCRRSRKQVFDMIDRVGADGLLQQSAEVEPNIQRAAAKGFH